MSAYDRASGPQGAVRLVVFDVDGTLTTASTLIPFLRQLVGPTHWPRIFAQAVADTVSQGPTRAQLKICLLHRCLIGRDETEVKAIADAYARDVVPGQCRDDALARWAWHQACGDRMVLASASPELYVRPLGRILGTSEILATELVVDAGKYTGALLGRNCRGLEKARRIRQLIAGTRHESIWFYTDSRSDRPSLELADVAIRAHPWQRIPAMTALPGEPAATPTTPGGTP